jgi:hypothetical protein
VIKGIGVTRLVHADRATHVIHDRMNEMWVAQPLALALALVLAASALAQAASRRDRAVPSYNNSYSAYRAASPASPPAAAGSYGGYSTDPHTRALEALADKYRPGW